MGSSIDSFGGRTVGSYKNYELTEKENEMCWKTETSLGWTNFTLIQEGFKAVFEDLGIGVKYDSEGKLIGIRFDVLMVLNAQLDEVDDEIDDSCDEIFDVAEIIEISGIKFVAHLDLISGQYCVYGSNPKVGENKILAIGKQDSFEEPILLLIKMEGFSFCLRFRQLEDDFEIGIGLADGDNEPSAVGDLPGDEDEAKYEYSVLTSRLASSCNYMTYLDSTRPDRFERLAKRIIL